MKKLAFAATALAMIAGTPAVLSARQAMPAPSASMSPEMTPTAAMPFVMMAGASDLYEIQSSRMALSKARTPAVRQYAQMMITHHTKTTRDVTTAARRAGMKPTKPKLTAMQADMIAQLRSAGAGADFERTYLTQQLQSHEMALALHTNYAQNGDTPQLKTAAQGAVPIVQQHLDRVRGMQNM